MILTIRAEFNRRSLFAIYRAWHILDLSEVINVRLMLDTQTSDRRFLAASALDVTWMDEIPDVAPADILFVFSAYPERWGDIWGLSPWLCYWMPSLRCFCLILETRLPDIGEGN